MWKLLKRIKCKLFICCNSQCSINEENKVKNEFNKTIK